MTQDTFNSLNQYLSDMKRKLAEPSVPLKHQKAPAAYKEWLAREVKKTQLRLENESVVTPKSK